MACILTFGRYMLFLSNFVLMIIGICVSILGVVLATKERDVGLLPQGTVDTAIIIAVVGACVSIVALIGCAGALYKNQFWITLYAGLLTAIFVAHVVVVILAYLFREDLHGNVSEVVKEKYLEYNNTEVKHVIDGIQSKFKCCGSTDNTTPWKQLHISRPSSCKDRKSKKVFKNGCIPTLFEYAKTNLNIIMTVAAIDGAIQIVAIIYCLAIANSLRKAQILQYVTMHE